MQPKVLTVAAIAGTITAVGLPRLPAVALRCAHLTQWVTAAGPDVVATAVAAAVLWLLAAWVSACYLLVLACRFPGLPGCVARRVARVAVPQVLLRLAAGSAGLGIVLAPVAAASAVAPAPSPDPGVSTVVATAAAAPNALDPQSRHSEWTQRGPKWPSAAGDEARPRGHTRPVGPAKTPPVWPASRTSVSRAPASRAPVSRTPVPRAPTDGTPAGSPAWPVGRSSASQSTRTPGAQPTDRAGRPTSGAHRGGSSTGVGGSGGTTTRGPSDGSAGTSVVVDPGDSLWLLAARRLGPDATTHDIARYWPQLYRANRPVVGTDPALLHAGERLAVPPPHTDR